jgi:hypothetical protein
MGAPISLDAKINTANVMPFLVELRGQQLTASVLTHQNYEKVVMSHLDEGYERFTSELVEKSGNSKAEFDKIQSYVLQDEFQRNEILQKTCERLARWEYSPSTNIITDVKRYISNTQDVEDDDLNFSEHPIQELSKVLKKHTDLLKKRSDVKVLGDLQDFEIHADVWREMKEEYAFKALWSRHAEVSRSFWNNARQYYDNFKEGINYEGWPLISGSIGHAIELAAEELYCNDLAERARKIYR